MSIAVDTSVLYYKVKYSYREEFAGKGKGKKNVKKGPAEQRSAIIAVPRDLPIDVSAFEVEAVFKPLNVLKLDAGQLLFKIKDEGRYTSIYVEGSSSYVTSTYSKASSKPGFPVEFTVEERKAHVVTNIHPIQSFLSGLIQRAKSLDHLNKEIDELRTAKKEIAAKIRTACLCRTELEGAVNALQHNARDNVVTELGLTTLKSETQTSSTTTTKARREESSESEDEDE